MSLDKICINEYFEKEKRTSDMSLSAFLEAVIGNYLLLGTNLDEKVGRLYYDSKIVSDYETVDPDEKNLMSYIVDENVVFVKKSYTKNFLKILSHIISV